jgi:hypothetical protein
VPVGGDVTLDKLDAPSNDQGEEQLQCGDVEGEGGNGQQGVIGGDAEDLSHGCQEVGQRGVGNLDALGPRGRARGIDDVRQVGWVRVSCEVGVALLLDCGPL